MYYYTLLFSNINKMFAFFVFFVLIFIYMKQKTKHILFSSVTIASIAIGATGTTFFAIQKHKFNQNVKFIDNFVSNLNNFNKPEEMVEDFVKGADISTYCEVIENFLFQNNIRKDDGSLYKYNEIFNNYYQGKTLDQYINENFFSYFKNGKRTFANLFEILNYYGINSIRIKVWNNPYDEEGNSFGGGTNDLPKTLWIIKEAKKYGINDFLIDYHYSDFWASPGRQYLPREWNSLSNEELANKIYDYTYESSKKILENCDEQTKVTFQIGNEISRGVFWHSSKDKDKENRINLEAKLLEKGIDAINDIKKELNIDNSHENKDKRIKVMIHYDVNFERWFRYEQLYEQIDGIHFSFYPLFYNQNAFENFVINIKKINEKYPYLELYVGEFAVNYLNSNQFYLLNQGTLFEKYIENHWNLNVEKSNKLVYDIMNSLSNLLPNIKTGIYYWEPANIMVGSNSWATKSGLQFLDNYEDVSNYKDINNWSANCLFDTNGIALPSLEIIKQFSRKPKINDFDIYQTEDIAGQWSKQNRIDKTIVNESNFIFNKDFTKLDLKDVFIKDYANLVYSDDQVIEIYLNETSDSIENELIKKIKYFYSSIMYKFIEFKNYWISDDGTWGSIEAYATNNNYYYKGNIKFYFNVHQKYFKNTQTINNLSNAIEIKSNDQKWYEKIIERLKNQDDWKFGDDIYEFLKVSGGARDDNSLWLWDENKKCDRDAEFFLLDNDEIRYKNNTVNYNVLSKHKIWVDTLGQRYSKGKHKIYFAIRKQIKDLDLKYNIDSTYSQVGIESWKYVDVLIYEIDLNII